MDTLISVVTVVIVGILVGAEFAVAVFVNPIFDRLPHNGGLAARTDGARLLGRVMPFWYIASVVLAVVTALAVAGSGRWFWVAGAGLLLVSVLMSVTLLVPINNRVRRWSGSDFPADWREQVGRWDRLHFVRVAVITAGFVLMAIAATR
ncbi:DUF1772 domain-containing protein [Nakamurella sp. A5-74]|uniref:DUF1772 domain-containing protein n=1 Tax=Nakamurella sp. A5-74 TaxID=3158264 RepID=A0AAU8DSK1_9ACTN